MNTYLQLLSSSMIIYNSAQHCPSDNWIKVKILEYLYAQSAKHKDYNLIPSNFDFSFDSSQCNYCTHEFSLFMQVCNYLILMSFRQNVAIQLYIFLRCTRITFILTILCSPNFFSSFLKKAVTPLQYIFFFK